MNQFTLKQKIIMGIVLSLLAGGIVFYVYGDREEEREGMINENLEVQEEVNRTKEEFSDTEVVVYVTGAVKQEGVYALKVNNRISDAIEKAGGLAENADIKLINLAYLLEDGMKIRVPFQGEEENEIQEDNGKKEEQDNKIMTKESGLPETKETEIEGQTNQIKTIEKINLNTASLEDLDRLPGIGPVIAQKIIDYRKEKGKFTQIEQIKEVKGIGESKFEKVKDYVCVK